MENPKHINNDTHSGAKRQPSWRLARPLVVGALSLALSYASGLWLAFVRLAEGATELEEPSFVLHWLRDSTLALPLVVLAVLAAVLLSRNLIERFGGGGGGGSSSRLASNLASKMVLGAMVALLTSLTIVMVVGPIHDKLFHAHHGGALELPYYLYMARDALLMLTLCLPISALVVVLMGGEPWAKPQATPRLLQRRFAMQGLVGALGVFLPVMALVFAYSLATSTDAKAQGTSVCNTPNKTFDVESIDLDITLNRFGDHDPSGKMYVLTGVDGQKTNGVQNVRDQEKKALPDRVSIGLHGGDAIQPLVIRANEGDCVQINFKNSASGGDYGIHVDGLEFDANSSSGDEVGNNPSSAVPQGKSVSYRYLVPNDPNLEGAHYLHPGAGNRAAVNHGLFGELVVEPPNSTYLDPNTTSADGINPDAAKGLKSGWEAIIVPGTGKPAFRENVVIYHEIGNESEKVFDVNNNELPIRDPHTQSYRPGSRALNYRSEPFMDRLDKNPDAKSTVYGSYSFSDPATPMPRGYEKDPTKMRIAHAGSEVFHVHHLHGGGIRWRYNPVADTTYDYSKTGLDKSPKTGNSPSHRLDSQAIGPGESYNTEHEGGAGGVQQGAGEFLFHCHIAEHYFSGMWSFWRVHDTLQPDVAPLPPTVEQSTPNVPQAAVDSSELIGKTFNGTKITEDNLKDWVEQQLPTQGAKSRDAKTGFSQDASVMDWKVDTSTGKPIYVGEKEDTSDWPDLPRIFKDHPGSLIVDKFLSGANSDRPKILFNPDNGRPSFPLLRAHIGDRPPFAPNGHSGAPYLGEGPDQSSSPNAKVNPWANRSDSICPIPENGGSNGEQIRHNNLVGITLPIQNTAKGDTDPDGALFVQANHKQDLYDGKEPSEPLALRANVGDCVKNTLTSELKDGGNEVPFSKLNTHIHHVQFDTQASDGVISGFSFEQSVRPYKIEDPQLTADAPTGETTLHLADVSKFQDGVSIGVGEGTDKLNSDIRKITQIDSANNTVTLDSPLKQDHQKGEWAGTEFVQYIWYPDVELDNIFFHDHVNGIFGWSHGMVGQLIVEPHGSTFHDPKTGKEVDHGNMVDIHTNNSLAPGVPGSYREMALWTIDNHSQVDSSLNLKAEPWNDRGGDPSQLFSSYAHGDPFTPLPRAYPGDPFVIRTINVGQGMQTLHVDGHRFPLEARYVDTKGNPEAQPIDTIHYGISEKETLILDGDGDAADGNALKDGKSGVSSTPGDYIYNDGVQRSFKDGAWGILRVLPGIVGDQNDPNNPERLQPLPNNPVSNTGTLPTKSSGAPPVATDSGGNQDPGNPCPSGAPNHDFNVSAIDLPNASDGKKFAYVPTDKAADIKSAKTKPEPLVLHVSQGECVNVNFKNDSSTKRASFHLNGLVHDAKSSGINVGYSPEQSVSTGNSQTYRYYADTEHVQSALISDFGGNEGSRDGLYGALVVGPPGATFTDSGGNKTDVGSQVDVHCPQGCTSDNAQKVDSYRDFSLIFADQDPQIGQSTMPYPISVSGPALVNYASAPLKKGDDTNAAFSSKSNGSDPATPILKAHAGDPVKVHMINAPGSEQLHTVSLGGLSWQNDPYISHAEHLTTKALGPQEKIDAEIVGGAGGPTHTVGDFIYQDRRLAFTDAGMWGLMRVLPTTDTSIKALSGSSITNPPQSAPQQPAKKKKTKKGGKKKKKG